MRDRFAKESILWLFVCILISSGDLIFANKIYLAWFSNSGMIYQIQKFSDDINFLK